MKFKSRTSTDFLQVTFEDSTANSIHELRSTARQQGELDVDFHYVIQKDGTVEEGRDAHSVAHYSLDYPDRTLTIYVNAPSKKRMTDAQRFSYENLCDSLAGTYPELML